MGTQNYGESGRIAMLYKYNGEVYVVQAGSNLTGFARSRGQIIGDMSLREYLERRFETPDYTGWMFFANEMFLPEIVEPMLSDTSPTEDFLRNIGFTVTSEVVSGCPDLVVGERMTTGSLSLPGTNIRSKSGNIYKHPICPGELVGRDVKGVILHWTGDESVADDTLVNTFIGGLSRGVGRSVHLGLSYDELLGRPKWMVVVPFIEDGRGNLVAPRVMGAGPFCDQLDAIQIEISGKYFDGYLSLRPIVTLGGGYDHIDRVFISDSRSADVTSNLVQFLTYLCKEGYISVSDIVGHRDVSLVGKVDPGGMCMSDMFLPECFIFFLEMEL